ncbi:MAG: NUDIX hydrolase [Bdellovibrionales bacterium]|nr:NUDIX hydrolase [Bdellovibrionales bacterium]
MQTPRVRRVTVSLLIPLSTDRRQVLGVRFRTKRNGLYGIPGGGLEIDQSIFEAATAECREELGFEHDPKGWRIFAIRCNPARDSNPGKPLRKYVANCPEVLQNIPVTAEHNLDMVLLSIPGFAGDVPTLVPADEDEIERIVTFDLRALPDRAVLPISDDLELLEAYGRYVLDPTMELPITIA